MCVLYIMYVCMYIYITALTMSGEVTKARRGIGDLGSSHPKWFLPRLFDTPKGLFSPLAPWDL